MSTAVTSASFSPTAVCRRSFNISSGVMDFLVSGSGSSSAFKWLPAYALTCPFNQLDVAVPPGASLAFLGHEVGLQVGKINFLTTRVVEKDSLVELRSAMSKLCKALDLLQLGCILGPSFRMWCLPWPNSCISRPGSPPPKANPP